MKEVGEITQWGASLNIISHRIKGDNMGGVRSTYEKDVKCIQHFSRKTWGEEIFLGDKALDESIIWKYILKEQHMRIILPSIRVEIFLD
jgi:hypothetical protein